ITSQGLPGSEEDASAYLHLLYADRIAAEQDEARQDILTGTLEEEGSSATLPRNVRTGPIARQEEEEAGNDASNEETVPAAGGGVRFVQLGDAARPGTSSISITPERPPRWRRFAAVAAAVLLLGGATTVAALYARSRHQAAPEAPSPRER